MHTQPLHKLTATPEGILLDGQPLHQSLYKQLSSRALRYIQRADELLDSLHPEDWENRTQHTTNDVPTLAKAQMMLALANPILLDKYSPDQPRDWHGRWADANTDTPGTTSNSDQTGEYQVADSGQIMSEASTNNMQQRTVGYPDGNPIIENKTKTPYLIPRGMDIKANIRNAESWVKSGASQTKRDALMIEWFRQGGTQDYQRPNGYIAAQFGDRTMQYRSITNYNYGVIAAAMGYNKEETLGAAGLHNRVIGNTHQTNMTIYGIQQESVDNITHGYDDYMNGRWK